MATYNINLSASIHLRRLHGNSGGGEGRQGRGKGTADLENANLQNLRNLYNLPEQMQFFLWEDLCLW